MDLKKLRKECIADTNAGLSVVGNDRKAVEMWHSVEKLEKGISALKDENEADEALKSLSALKKKKMSEISALLESFMPETLKAAGAEVSCKLLAKAGSLKKLAEMPSSKIQLLGAEKALFRHLKQGSSSPKHGIISMHESVRNADNKGKAARQFASEISKAVKVDYYRQTL